MDRLLPLKYAGGCTLCGAGLSVGTQAVWNSETKAVTCLDCINDPAGPDTATDAGGSAAPDAPDAPPAAGWRSAVREGVVQTVSAVAAGILLAVLGLSETSTATKLLLAALVSALVAALVDSARRNPSRAWQVYRSAMSTLLSVVVTVVDFAIQLVLATVMLLTGVPTATSSQRRYQAALVARRGRGHVVWWSKTQAARNIRQLRRR